MADAAVLWKNSPLYHYLKEVGEVASGDDDDGDEGKEHQPAQHHSDGAASDVVGSNTHSTCSDKGTRAIAARIRAGWQKVQEKRAQRAVQRVARCITRSPHLHDDDALLLLQADERLLNSDSSEAHAVEPFASVVAAAKTSWLSSAFQAWRNTIPYPSPTFTASTTITTIVAGLLVTGGGMIACSGLDTARRLPSCILRMTSGLTFTPRLLHGAAAAFAATAAAWAAFRCTTASARWLPYRRDALCSQALADLLDCRQAFIMTCHQALVTLQRVELLRRGFGLAEQMPPISRIEEGSTNAGTSSERGGAVHASPACSALRHCLQRALLSSLFRVREFTQRVVQSHPLHPVMDERGRRLAEQPLLELGITDDDLCEDTTPSVASLKALFDMEVLHFSELLRRIALYCSPTLCSPATTALSTLDAIVRSPQLQRYRTALSSTTSTLDLVHNLELLWQGEPPSPEQMHLISRCRQHETSAMAHQDVPGYTAYAQLAADTTLTCMSAGAQVKILHDAVLCAFVRCGWSSASERKRLVGIADALCQSTRKLSTLAARLSHSVETWRWEGAAAQGLGANAAGDGQQGGSEAGGVEVVVAVDGQGDNEPRVDEYERPFDYFEAEAQGQRSDDDDDDDLTEEERTARWRAQREERRKRYELERQQERMRQQQQQTTTQLLSELNAVLRTMPKR